MIQFPRWISWIFLLSLAVSPTVPIRIRAPVISTKTGKIQGIRKIYKGCCMDVYYGIPFAKPPVGDLRFRTTVPVEKWNGILNATVKRPACPQGPFHGGFSDEESIQSEDCLYLNIWTRCNKKNRAVMIWIHGGKFTHGSASMSLYDGSEIVALGDVTFVNFNYRLGILGFLSSNTEDAPGNAAMHDQAVALKWVHENVGSFGGNSSRITLFGQSAGSLSTSMHALSPLTSELFDRMIMQSASSAALVLSVTHVLNLNTTDKIAKAVGCSSSSDNIVTKPKAVMDCMRKTDYMVLVNNSKDIQFLPQYGDPFMPKDPRLLIISGKTKKCDRIMGVTADEGSLFWSRKFINLYGKFGEKIQHPNLNKNKARLMMTEVLSNFAIPPGFSELVIEHYLNKVRGDDNEEVVRQAYTATGDAIIICPTVYEAEKVDQRNKVFFYKFSHRPTYTNTAEWAGVTHSSDLLFVFGAPLRNGELKPKMRFTKVERILSRRIIKMWTNFAKGRFPGNEKSWPQYSYEHPSFLILNTTNRFKIGQGPHRDNCDVFRPIYGFVSQHNVTTLAKPD